MTKRWLIGGGIALGGLVAWLASRDATVPQLLRRSIRRIARMGLTQSTIDNFNKYGLAGLINQTCGPLPPALLAAIIDMESSGEPGKYNHYPNGVGNPPKKIGTWVAGTPLPDGTNGQPNAWAAGLMQIIRKYPRNLTLVERFDPLKNLTAVVNDAEVANGATGLAAMYRKAAARGVKGSALWAATYFGHNQGPVPFDRALDNLTAAGGDFEKAVQTASNISAGVKGAYSTAKVVAARVPLWAAVLVPQAKVAVIGTADDIPGISPEDMTTAVQMAQNAKQSATEALLAAAQQAEMNRDLETAVELRAQLEALQGTA